MKKILLGFFIAIVIVISVISYYFTDSSIKSRAKDIALNSDACLFFMSSSEYGEKNVIYCSYNNSLRVIKGSTFAITSTPVITDETLKGLGEVIVFETFKRKNIESNNVKLYQYGNLFELKNVNMYDIPAYSIAVKRTVAGATY